jgi:hypothetical protein
LTVCAYLDPDGIPKSLLHQWLVTAYPSMSSHVDTLTILLSILRNYSLIQLDQRDNPMISIHRVLASVLRDQHHAAHLTANQEFYPNFSEQWFTTLVTL